ncbi:uncharacterized protein LOC143465635 isoform X2 [Clavelina lepadiformis]|uniref:uncharacterized protein LOC143465635 isoform X2 n=1 Tax=Clavelina lepadiformis TaxID=159417 RepID=UPI0040436C19
MFCCYSACGISPEELHGQANVASHSLSATTSTVTKQESMDSTPTSIPTLLITSNTPISYEQQDQSFDYATTSAEKKVELEQLKNEPEPDEAISYKKLYPTLPSASDEEIKDSEVATQENPEESPLPEKPRTPTPSTEEVSEKNTEEHSISPESATTIPVAQDAQDDDGLDKKSHRTVTFATDVQQREIPPVGYEDQSYFHDVNNTDEAKQPLSGSDEQPEFNGYSLISSSGSQDVSTKINQLNSAEKESEDVEDFNAYTVLQNAQSTSQDDSHVNMEVNLPEETNGKTDGDEEKEFNSYELLVESNRIDRNVTSENITANNETVSDTTTIAIVKKDKQDNDQPEVEGYILGNEDQSTNNVPGADADSGSDKVEEKELNALELLFNDEAVYETASIEADCATDNSVRETESSKVEEYETPEFNALDLLKDDRNTNESLFKTDEEPSVPNIDHNEESTEVEFNAYELLATQEENTLPENGPEVTVNVDVDKNLKLDEELEPFNAYDMLKDPDLSKKDILEKPLTPSAPTLEDSSGTYAKSDAEVEQTQQSAPVLFVGSVASEPIPTTLDDRAPVSPSPAISYAAQSMPEPALQLPPRISSSSIVLAPKAPASPVEIVQASFSPGPIVKSSASASTVLTNGRALSSESSIAVELKIDDNMIDKMIDQDDEVEED